MNNTIITIGRELGSGGRTIGKMVAQKLGVPYYDREKIDEAAKKIWFIGGVYKEYRAENDNKLSVQHSNGSWIWN
jgi:shikimate kinase